MLTVSDWEAATDCLYSPHNWNVENGQSSVGSIRTWIPDNLTNVTVADWHWNWLWGLRLREYYWTREIIKRYWFVGCFITAQTTLLHLDQDFRREREGPVCKKNLKEVGDWLRTVCVASLGQRHKTKLKGNKISQCQGFEIPVWADSFMCFYTLKQRCPPIPYPLVDPGQLYPIV